LSTVSHSPRNGRNSFNPHDSDDDDFTFTDMISLSYPDKAGATRSGIITIQLKYSPSSTTIGYLDVQYSDSELERLVESNANVLKNIDGYLRNRLLKLQYNI
jgi:hypothetical protein